ncbi:MAG TPA: DUF1611 domain-containing protein [Candidatus Eisenbacteria bacterium]|nr:DUF1611 domain-containing protein [Candidatus Eisenbacteria bacterium]
MSRNRKNAIVLASKAFSTLEGKTANDLVIYGGKYEILAVIDEGKAGKDAGKVLGIGRKNIPIVRNLKEALKYKPGAIIIGIAPPGGSLPEEWKGIVKEAIRNGLDVVSGLHYFFGDQPEFSELAKKHRVKLVDLRKPPKNLEVLMKLVNIKVPVVAILSTDAATGKNIVMMELAKEAEKRGFKVGAVATGQTMMLVRGDAGAAIDAIPGDFIPGTVAKMTSDVAKMDKDLIIVEGQASLSHPAYGVETLAILYGSQPDAVIMVHDPFRGTRDGFPTMKVPSLNEEIHLIETLCPKTKVVGIAISYIYNYNGLKSDDEVRAAVRRAERETNLPATDVQRFGTERLFDAMAERFKQVKKTLRKT